MASPNLPRRTKKERAGPRLTAYSRLTGVRILSAERGRAEAALSLSDRLTNRRGVLHGGAMATLLDTTLGAATISAMAPEEWCATTSLSIQFISGARDGDVRATAEVLRRGKRIAFVRGEARDGDGNLLAVAQGVWHIWPAESQVAKGANARAGTSKRRAPRGA